MTPRHVETCSFSSKCWFPKAVESRSLAGAHKCLVSTSGIMECQEMSDQPSIAKLAAGACRSTSAQLFQLSSSEVSVELELELCHADIQASQLLVDLHTVSCSNATNCHNAHSMLTQCSLTSPFCKKQLDSRRALGSSSTPASQSPQQVWSFRPPTRTGQRWPKYFKVDITCVASVSSPPLPRTSSGTAAFEPRQPIESLITNGSQRYAKVTKFFKVSSIPISVR